MNNHSSNRRFIQNSMQKTAGKYKMVGWPCRFGQIRMKNPVSTIRETMVLRIVGQFPENSVSIVNQKGQETINRFPAVNSPGQPGSISGSGKF